jgi:hypothetical protein
MSVGQTTVDRFGPDSLKQHELQSAGIQNVEQTGTSQGDERRRVDDGEHIRSSPLAMDRAKASSAWAPRRSASR